MYLVLIKLKFFIILKFKCRILQFASDKDLDNAQIKLFNNIKFV